MLIGPNNSGKTAVLDALSLLPHPECPMPKGVPVVGDENKLHTLRGETKLHALVNLRGGEPRYLIHSYAGEAELRYTLAVASSYREVIVRLSDSWGVKVAVRAGAAERPAQIDVRNGEVERLVIGSEEPREVLRRALLEERRGLRP